MSKSFTVSIPNSDKFLIKWIEARQANGELSPSDIFRSAMIQKKGDWEIAQSQNPLILLKQIKLLKKTVKAMLSFLTIKKLDDEFRNFEPDEKIKLKEIETIIKQDSKLEVQK